jgi:hypothetical protein
MLRATQLIGFAAKRTLPTINYVIKSFDTTNASSYSYSSLSIGAASSDRLVIAVMTNHNGSSTAVRTLSSCTIGGISATVAGTGGEGVAGGSSVGWGVAHLLVAAGTTATIDFTLSGGASNCLCSVYTVTGWTSQAPTVYSDTARAIEIALGSHPNGAALGAAVHNTTDQTYTTSSTGSVQPTIVATDAHGSEAGYSALISLTNASGSPTVSITSSSSTTNEAGFVAVWE